MKKKFLALVLTLAMVLSLVPATALAMDGTDGGASQKVTRDNLTMTKTVTPVQNKDGTYTVRLESYATGEVKNTTTTKSSDIVLLLDVSGSMNDRYATKDTYSLYDGYNNYWLKYYSTTHWGLWYKTDANIYVPVSVNKESKYGYNNDKYTYSYTNDEGKVIIEESIGKYTQPTTQFYYKTDATKMDVLKEAVNAFIDDVAEKSPTSQISIVKFAGEKTDRIGNDTYSGGENYTQIVTKLTKVGDGGADQLKQAVSKLTAAGATSSDYGLQKAQKALENATKDKVVVLFTDGEPNHSNGFNYKVATDAVNTAKTLKDESTTIYTVGVFKDPSERINKYMSSVSSNYPDASATVTGNGWKVTNGGSKVGEHYINAENAADLIKAFQTISSEVSSTPLDASAVVVDNVPSNFALTEGSVKVYTENCIAKNGETFKWDTKTESTIRPTIEDQSISVTGFNFSKNWCGLDENNQACGQKLIIEFTIKCTNYGGTQRTNAGAYIKANAGSTDRIIWVDDPEVPVTVQLPGVNNPAVKTKPYDGAGFDIKDEIGKIIAGLVPVDGIKNQFIDLTYEIKDSSNETVGTYTIPAGQDTGTWSDTSTNITTGPNVGNYTYKITVTGQDKKQPNNDDSKDCTATFTITKRNVTFAGESKRVEWNGKEQTITGITPTGLLEDHTFSELTYAATGTEPDTYNGVFTGNAIIKDADGTDVTANYKVKTEPGTLTITDSTSTATVTFKIVGGTWSDDNTAKNKTVQVTLTNGKGSLNGADIPTGSPSDGHTGPGAWSNDANITGDPVNGMEITKNTVFTLTYSEIKPEITNVDVTFKIVGGTWNGDNPTAEDKTVQVTLTNGKGSLADVTIPTGVADADHQGDGTWSPATPQAGTEITQDGNKVFTLTFQEKEEQKPADPVKLDVSRSKTAKPLDTSTWTSNVTLSLPSAEYEPVIDVVFILDDTYAGNGIFKDAATGLLNELSEKKNLDVNVGIVNFDAVARDWVAATTNSQYSGLVSLKNTEGLTALQNAIATKLDKNNDGQTKKIGATNIEWPLEMAQDMLASGKGTEKYAILFSDMYGYVYRGDLIIDDQTYENVPLSKRLYAGESKFYQGSLSMGTKYQSFADVYAHRNDEENQTIDGFFRDSSWNSYWSIYSGYMQIPTNPATKDSADPFGVSGGYSGFEKSTCLVYDRLLQMKQAGINISIVNNDFAPGDIGEVGYVQSIKNDMLNTLKKEGISVIKTQENVTAEDMTNVFDTLKDQLIQVVSAGSTVTDKIGTNFDFVGLNTMSLKIGDDTIPGVIDEATNTITFKHADKNDAHVVAYDSDANSFKWTINEDVTKDARVQLTYTVKLKTPQTLAGTYGVEDLNGDEKVDGTGAAVDKTKALYTNQEAKLVPKDSNGNTGMEQTFPMPSVSYTIKGSSGGHGGNGGGTVTIPDDVPTGLNGKDHYAYVVGYPDGMVYPQKNITRAEVATIFFRLLKDETREANMTKSNSYNDMKDGAWYTCAVSTLSKMGIIKGYEDGSFKPDASISRAEFAAIAARFDPDGDKTPATFSDVSSHWAKDEISIAANHGWIKGYEDGSFKPDQKITRAETMTLVNRVLKRLPETKDDLHKDMKTWPDNQKESAWFYLAVQEATNSHYQKLKKDGIHETWESMRETRDWAALEK